MNPIASAYASATLTPPTRGTCPRWNLRVASGLSTSPIRFAAFLTKGVKNRANRNARQLTSKRTNIVMRERESFEGESAIHGFGYLGPCHVGFEGSNANIEFRQFLGEIVLRGRRAGHDVLQGPAGGLGDVARAVSMIASLEQFELLLGEAEGDHLFSAVG